MIIPDVVQLPCGCTVDTIEVFGKHLQGDRHVECEHGTHILRAEVEEQLKIHVEEAP